MTDPDPRVRRAVATLDLFAEVLPGLLCSVRARAEQGRQMALDMGVSAPQWSAMTSDDRLDLLRRRPDVILPQVAAHAGLTHQQWKALTNDERLDLVDKWRVEVRDATGSTAA